MRRGALAAILAAAAIAALLAGCGGDEESQGTETGAPAETQGTAASGSRTGVEGASPTEQGKGQKPPAEADAPTPAEPLPNEGGKEVAPGVPTERGGDNSIQEYGVEGPSEDRVAASRNLKAYLDALAAKQPARACSYVSEQAKGELLRFMESAPDDEQAQPPSCAEILGRFAGGAQAKELRSAADIRVLSMRIEGERAYLVYEDGEGTPTAISMVEEGGEWRLATFGGTGLR